MAPDFDDVVRHADEEATQRRLSDPEMSKKRFVHLSHLVAALSSGVLSADPYDPNPVYTVPSGFEAVLNRFHFRLTEKFPKHPMRVEGFAEISLNDAWEVLSSLPMLDPEYRKWVAHRMDGQAVIQNAIHYLKLTLREIERPNV